MKTLKIYRPLAVVAAVTLALLSIPLIAMYYTDGVKWDISDFVIMGALLFGTGAFYVYASRRSSGSNLAFRLAAGLSGAAILLLIWADLAVGLIGSGPNIANLLYIGVVAVAIIGTTVSRFRAKEMARTMFATAASLLMLTVIVLMAGVQHRSDSSLGEILAVNGFFCTVFALAGILFRLSSRNVPTTN